MGTPVTEGSPLRDQSNPKSDVKDVIGRWYSMRTP